MRQYGRLKNLRSAISLLSVCSLAPFGVSPASAFDEIRPGVYRSDWRTIDDLLSIGDQAELSVLVLEDHKTKTISDAHMTALRQWVESGGVLWVAGEGLESPLAQAVAPFRTESFDFVRSRSGKRGGELIVKGISPRMTIVDGPFTAEVNQLYLFARSRFDGTSRAEPLVQMGDSEGNSGWVLAAVPIGRGFLILDGTARKNHKVFRRLKGFDEDHPNSLEQDSMWNSYDWTTLQDNVRDWARRALDGDDGTPLAGRSGWMEFPTPRK
jgi:hypothetical protein